MVAAIERLDGDGCCLRIANFNFESQRMEEYRNRRQGNPDAVSSDEQALLHEIRRLAYAALATFLLTLFLTGFVFYLFLT